ncbi:hypothetical protein [Paenibacillus dauci]|uniref:hypothetical protein n=1 Tax=Paenibacillus dauci TaxID=1567106 RepID=UPI00061A0948|nr:hypothetical protein [Paenibacillus dauci]
MKNITAVLTAFFAAILIFTSTTAHAEGLSVTKQYSYKLPRGMVLKSAEYSPDGHMYLAVTDSKSNVSLIAVNAKGKKVWSKPIGNTVETGLWADEKDNVYYSYVPWVGNNTIIIKRNKSGKVLWQKKIDFSSNLNKIGDYLVLNGSYNIVMLDLNGKKVKSVSSNSIMTLTSSSYNVNYVDASTQDIQNTILANSQVVKIKDSTLFDVIASPNLNYLAAYNLSEGVNDEPDVYFYNNNGKLIYKKQVKQNFVEIIDMYVTDKGEVVYTTSQEDLVVLDREGNVKASTKLETKKYQEDVRIRPDDNNQIHYLDKVYNLSAEKIADFGIDATYYYAKPNGNLFTCTIENDKSTTLAYYTLNK